MICMSVYGRLIQGENMYNKKIVSFILLFVLLSSIAYGHPGKTDSNGGHTDSSTGEYHYHHGYPAHQHTGGVCPYDYDDRTGYNSGSTNGNKKENNGSISSDIDKEPKPSVRSQIILLAIISFGIAQGINKFGLQIIDYLLKTKFSLANELCPWKSAILIWISVFSALFDVSFRENLEPKISWFIIPICIILLYVFTSYKAEKQKKIECEEKLKFEEEKQEYVQFFSEHTIEELCDLPDGTEIGTDGLPKEKEKDGWGKYTAYISTYGKSYHSKEGCSNAYRKIHLYYAQMIYKPCKRCVKENIDFSWYRKAKKFLDIKNKYGIK